MNDPQAMLQQLANELGGGEKAIAQLRAALNSAGGKQAAQVISAQHAAELEQAAAAAQRGDFHQAARLAQKLMQSPDGARLAAQLKSIFPK